MDTEKNMDHNIIYIAVQNVEKSTHLLQKDDIPPCTTALYTNHLIITGISGSKCGGVLDMY